MLGIILTTTYSCKKDISDLQSSQSDEIVSKNNVIIKLIKQFETKMHSNFKSGESIDLDSAVWNMEALQNYSYAYPDSSTKDFVVMKSYYTIPVNSSNKALMSDVQTVNQLMEDTLLYQLSLFPEEVKCMKFWDVNADSVIGTTAYLSATSGFGLNIIIGTYYGFSSDDDWIWVTLDQGFDPPAGKCDGTMVGVSDGSDELEWRLNNPALQPSQYIAGYTSLETYDVHFLNCYYNEPPYLDRVFNKLNQAQYCMEDTELTDFLLAADLIVNDYNDPSNDNSSPYDILVLDGEGARPIGKDFVSISIKDELLMVGGSTFMHIYTITYGIPYYYTPN